jgi:RNA polymerase sigma factor (sigma-70 family)
MLFRERPELLPPFRRGERPALEAVYRRYVRLIETLLRQGTQAGGGRVFVSDTEMQKDLVQDVFARAFGERARLAFDGLREYRPYLLTIARNILVDWARKRKETLRPDIDELCEQMQHDQLEPEAAWADPETVRQVEAYIKDLPAELRRLHTLRYDAGCSQDEVARQLGLSRQNVRTMESKLRSGLSAYLEANQTRRLAVGTK